MGRLFVIQSPQPIPYEIVEVLNLYLASPYRGAFHAIGDANSIRQLIQSLGISMTYLLFAEP